jgi:hypothetical protein
LIGVYQLLSVFIGVSLLVFHETGRGGELFLCEAEEWRHGPAAEASQEVELATVVGLMMNSPLPTQPM